MKVGSSVLVRRHRGGIGWCTAHESHLEFNGGFNIGLMSNVQFIHRAPPMQCVAGYNSTGEAVGILDAHGCAIAMPDTVVSQVEVEYDRNRRIFHPKNSPEQIDRADFLLLQPDGTAIAGWVEAA